MHLYHLTLKPSSAAVQSILGNFSGTKQQEVILNRGSSIELLSVVDGKIVSLASANMFGVVRAIVPFRLTGGSKDMIVVGSDAGRITVLEYKPDSYSFEKVHQETFGKTGCRRIVPGQFLAADPKGRAVMIAAIEKQKLVYVLNRDGQGRPTIHSPLEFSKTNLLTFFLTALDVGFENPVFAALEVDSTESLEDHTGKEFDNLEKQLTYYELDLGLNHVVRRWSQTVDRSANYLIPLPGGSDGPSGVLVCSKNRITYVHQGVPSASVPIPRRPTHLRAHVDDVIITCATVHKTKKAFFIFCQTEDGDVFKMTVACLNADGNVAQVHLGESIRQVVLKIKYLDTIPPATSLNIFKAGFLFAASEMGSHGLYQIESLGEDDTTQIEYVSGKNYQNPSIVPRGLANIGLVDEYVSLNPLIHAQVHNLTMEDSPQIYGLTGSGPKSCMNILRHGLSVTELASSELPGTAQNVWTVKLSASDANDTYIVVSFASSTLVLFVGETVEEVSDSGFLLNTTSLCVGQIGEDSLLQVYPHGIRHIRSNKRVSEWKCPPGKYIVKADANDRQVVIALSSAEVIYFELDSAGNLNEFQERKEMSAPITALSLGPLAEGRLRTKFLAVCCADNTARLFYLDPERCLESLGLQAVTAAPHSVKICNIEDDSSTKGLAGMYLYIGLANGVLVRSAMDDVTGALSDTKMRFLGTRAVQLAPLKIQSKTFNAMMSMSTSNWLSYLWRTRNRLVNLDYEPFSDCASFENEMIGQGIVGVSGDTLRIIALEKLGTEFTMTSHQLKYSPRKFLMHPDSGVFVILEREYNVACPFDAQKQQSGKGQEDEEDDDMDMDMDDDEEGNVNANNEGGSGDVPPEFGYTRKEHGWASCIRLMTPTDGVTLMEIELDQNEAAFSACVTQFADDSTKYLVVGTAQNVVLTPRSCSSGFIRVYKFNGEGTSVDLVHTTAVEDIPYAVAEYQGRVLAGIGNTLRMYDMGKKKLLRKCEYKEFTNLIMDIKTYGSRICVCDIQESFHFATYKAQENRILIFADDTVPRFLTCCTFVDYDTVAGGDKFGNVFVSRLPADSREEVEDDPTGNLLVRDMGHLHGAPSRFTRMADFYVGDTITSLQKVSLVAGAKEVLVYTTLYGAVGVFIPLGTKDDVEFFGNLEMEMRSLGASLCGRDHAMYRGSYAPVKGVVDGDLIEEFLLLPPEKRRTIASQLERSAVEVVKKIEDIRGRFAF